jgi:glutamate-1-semialdehyde 2,1-aminomutase
MMSVVDEYVKRTPNSKALYERACKVMPGGYTRGPFQHNPYPSFLKRAEGCRIWDVDGNEYIDYVNNYGPLILGHRPPKVLEAVKAQVEQIWLGGMTEAEVRLAEKVTELVPCAESVLFCPTGSEACMNAIRTYRALSGRDKIAMWDGGYHGSTDSLYFSKGIPADTLNKVVLLPYNDAAGVEKQIRKNRDELACVIVDPTLGEIGHEPANLEFYRALREVTEDTDVPLIFDEVVDGFRLAPGGAQERFGVRADMSVLGKILGGGFPLAAYTSSEETMKIWSIKKPNSLDIADADLSHPGTFNDHKISMAAGFATLNELTPETYSHLEKVGSDIRNGLRKILENLRIKAQVVGISSIFHLQFSDEPIVDARSGRRANKLLYRCFELSMLNKGINLGKRHSSFISTPIANTEVTQTLKAAEDTLIEMKPLLKAIAPSLLTES